MVMRALSTAGGGVGMFVAKFRRLVGGKHSVSRSRFDGAAPIGIEVCADPGTVVTWRI